MVGHYVPVPAETGWTDGDLEDQYISARYRVYINKAQYDRVMVFVRHLQASKHVWSAELYNCNAFVSDIAQFMGLRVPKSTLIYPKVFINNLRQINTRPGKPSAAPRLSVGSAGPKVTIVSAPHHQQFRGGRVESLRTRDRDVQCDDAPPIRSDIPNPRTVGRLNRFGLETLLFKQKQKPVID